MNCAFAAFLVLGTSIGCTAQENAKASPPVETNAPAKMLTEAERIAQTERLLEEARGDLAKAVDALEDPESDYAKAEAAFKPLDAKLAEAKKAIAKLRAEDKAGEAAKAEAAMKPLVADWEKARDRFNLAIGQRKAVQEKKAALAAQIVKYEQSLEAMKHPPEPLPGKTDTAQHPAIPNAPAANTPTAKEPAAPALPVMPGVPVVPLPAAPKENTPAKPAPDDAEIRTARAYADGRRAELAAVEEKAKSVEDRVRVQEQLIATEDRLLEAERKVANQAEGELADLTQKLATAKPADQPELLARLGDTQKRLAGARQRIADLTDRLATLNDDLRSVQQERIEAGQQIDAKRKEAEDAEGEVSRLQNPLTMRNLNKWLATHGVNMVLIGIGIVSLHLVVRLSSRQIVRFVARNSNRGSEGDRENRANTLVGVFRYATTLVIFGGGIVMLMDEAGIPVVPLMGGAAVVGLAVAFGAQNLIKDYFSGFMMLLEDQYGVNDVVKIGALSGLVEKITLRVTVLRDLEGVLHFIPHGQVNAVSNMTHGWSRALFDVPVPHDADLDRLMGEFVKLGRELRADPIYGMKIADDPEMLGVESLDATAAVVRFLVKTRPLQQWAVKRELLRRIKLRLDELGVALPPPRRTFEVVPADGGQYEGPHRLWPAGAKTGT